MVTDGDDDQRSEEGSRGEKRCLELLATSLGSYGEEETRSVRVREEEDSVSTELDECKNQQNPTTYLHDYASSSSSSWSLSSVESKKRRVVYQEPINAEPLREVKPSVRGKKSVKPERGVTPEWLVNLMITEKGVGAKLVIDKMIQTSDVNPNQGRLLIPFKQIVEMDFLNEAELHLIDEHQRDNSSNKGVAVIVVASDGRKRNAKLRRWNMNCPNYSLCSGWNHVVRENNLEDKVGQIFRLWSFHSQDGTKLYLAFFHQPPASDMSQAMHAASSSSMALERDSGQCILDLNVPFVQERRDRRTSLESVTETTTVDLVLRLGRSVDLNIPMAPVGTEMAPLEAVQDTSLESVTETTTVDLVLRLGRSVDLNIPMAPVGTEMAPLEAVQETSLESVTETTTTVDLELRL
uniref:TF-B3 domain-containing protein n=1 Tax=Brassica campestris TaxID=3711 RepID=M4CN58_BRACM